jgi:hypothetical protein
MVRERGPYPACCTCAGSWQGIGSWRTTSLDNAQWGACCSCKVSLVSETAGPVTGQSSWGEWHAYVLVECGQESWYVGLLPGTGLNPWGGDVVWSKGNPATVQKTYSTCDVDCATARKRVDEWYDLSKNGWAFYAWPIHGSWLWPKDQFDKLCKDGYKTR